MTARVTPMVSVFMMTYNHALYVRQALDSVLNQKTTFSVEIVIGDDFSTDGTRAIVAEYAQKYPARIHALMHKRNMGAGRNQQLVLEACDGKYVAILEGDDYWIDLYKLQKQVMFLEENPSFSIVFSRVYELINGEKMLAHLNPWDVDKVFSIHDLAAGNFIHTPSVVFRNGLINKYPDWFVNSPVGDYVIHLLNSKRGLIQYFSEPMAVYRKFAGTWSSRSKLCQINSFIKLIDMLILEDFDIETTDILRFQRQSLLSEYCVILLNDNDFSFLEKLQHELMHESAFVQHWVISIYPEKIKSIINSRSYKFASIIMKIKSKFF